MLTMIGPTHVPLHTPVSPLNASVNRGRCTGMQRHMSPSSVSFLASIEHCFRPSCSFQVHCTSVSYMQRERRIEAKGAPCISHLCSVSTMLPAIRSANRRMKLFVIPVSVLVGKSSELPVKTEPSDQTAGVALLKGHQSMCSAKIRT
jgi:hypothetical protein